VTYDNTDRFYVKKLVLHGNFEIPEFKGHFIMITSKGDVKLSYEAGNKAVPQGRGVFVPSKVKALSAYGSGELIIAYPPKLTEATIL
jgi:mannose-6-phosphate isomerase class I